MTRTRRGGTLGLALALAILLAGCVTPPTPEPPRSPAPAASPAVTARPGSPAAPSASAATGPPVGRSTQVVTVAGMQREVRLYRPAHLSVPGAVVVVLHGGGGSAASAEAAYGWDRAAEEHGFVVAYPESDRASWNAGTCCGQASARNVDDVGFVVGVAQQVAREVSADPARTYLTGFSNGAMLSYRIACETGGVFAAVAPVSGTQLVPCADPRPVSLLAIHGTADTSVPYQGGPGEGVGDVDGPSAPSVNQRWRDIDRCDAPTEETSGVITRSSANCPEGRTVELITIAGGGHHWPGSVASGRNPSNAASSSVDATEEIWAFFNAHSR